MSIKRQTVTVSPCGFSADFYKVLKDFTIEVVQKDCIHKEDELSSVHQQMCLQNEPVPFGMPGGAAFVRGNTAGVLTLARKNSLYSL